MDVPLCEIFGCTYSYLCNAQQEGAILKATRKSFPQILWLLCPTKYLTKKTPQANNRK